MYDFAEKNVLVTGSARGIGKAIAERFAREGANILIADILLAEAEKTAEDIQNNYGVMAVSYGIDLLNNDEIEKMMSFMNQKMGSIDVVICNAGISIRNWATDYTIEQIDTVFGIDLRAHYLCARSAARYMKNQINRGNIVCISSVNSEKYHSKRSLYNIAKSAINGMAGTLGVEWARFNIRINAVAPGYVATDLVKEGIRSGMIDIDRNMEVIPMKRMIEAEEIANAVAFLASSEASAITGQVLYVDGGWSKNALPEELKME